jgi:hypothetical protein
MAEGGATLACVLLFGLPGRRRWQSLLSSLVLFVAAFGITGCGGMANGLSQPNEQFPNEQLNGISNNPTPSAAPVLGPGIYTVIVTGTANVFTKSQPNTTVEVVHNLQLQVVVR